jgi:Arc/MetJ-type ribon-helix-helix transcriptional regulator
VRPRTSHCLQPRGSLPLGLHAAEVRVRLSPPQGYCESRDRAVSSASDALPSANHVFFVLAACEGPHAQSQPASPGARRRQARTVAPISPNIKTVPARHRPLQLLVSPLGLRLQEGMIDYRTMAKSKIAVTLDKELLDRIDGLVAERRYPNRSQAIEIAVSEKLERLTRGRLARESAKLDRREERALADEGLTADRESWPEY